MTRLAWCLAFWRVVHCARDEWIRTGNWTTLTCDEPAVVNSDTMAPAERWGQLDCDHAWADVLVMWKSSYYQENSIRFGDAMFDQFHSRPSPDCERVERTGSCQQPVKCNSHQDSGPAITVILSSLIAVHLMFHHWYRGLVDLANTNLLDLLGTDFGILSNTSSDEDKARISPILQDMVPLGAIIAAAPSFNISVDETAYMPVDPKIRRHVVDTAISTLVPILKKRIQIRKENETEDPWGYNALHQITSFGPHPMYVYYAWSSLPVQAAFHLFSGSEDAIASLTSLIENGTMLPATVGGNNNKLVAETESSGKARRDALAQAVYGFGLPAAWIAQRAGVFVFDSGISCDGSLDAIVPSLMSAETAAATSACYNGRQYFLVGAKKSGKFTVPQGLEKLGSDKYAGLSREDIIVGSIRTYENNGNKNGAPALDPTDEKVIENIYELGVTTPGYIRLAVCGADEVSKNRGNNNGYTTYPCEKVPGSAAGPRIHGRLSLTALWGALFFVLVWVR
ncbi:hypothetical protein QBC47DRAFT_96587 [Echria macrotheca]|uniref:Uncharacterized protein n=1 Tax=Echria macrotheca TaxID=438768 RepID=A0AAJ0F9A5_9PEZI|nr:hypothetical protein QBC47DRAFT_96587 [Echria macrotheca]